MGGPSPPELRIEIDEYVSLIICFQIECRAFCAYVDLPDASIGEEPSHESLRTRPRTKRKFGVATILDWYALGDKLATKHYSPASPPRRRQENNVCCP